MASTTTTGAIRTAGSTGVQSPASEMSDFEHLSSLASSITSAQFERINSSGNVDSRRSNSTSDADDDEIVWSVPSHTSSASPTSISASSPGVDADLSALTAKLNLKAGPGAGATQAQAVSHSRQNSIHDVLDGGDDFVLVGPGGSPQVEVEEDALNTPAPLPATSRTSSNSRGLWSEEVEQAGFDVSTPTAAVHTGAVSAPKAAKRSVSSNGPNDAVEAGKQERTTGSAWKRRNRRRKAAAALALADAADDIGAGTERAVTTPKPATRPAADRSNNSSKTRNAARSYPSPAPTPTPTADVDREAERDRDRASPKSMASDYGAAKGRSSPRTSVEKRSRNTREPRRRGSPRKPVPAPVDGPEPEQVTHVVGLGQRPVVDDVSESGDVVPVDKDGLLSVAYDEAVKFMNSFIVNPAYYTSRASQLTFLQALILELGLCHDPALALPRTLTAARSLLRSRAFLNVRDYLALRDQGRDALQAAMHPSRTSLIRDLRGVKKSSKGPSKMGERGARAPIGWVKETGLTVFLVSCYQ